MKWWILMWIGIIICLTNGLAQTSPTGINYQAVARGITGVELVSQYLDVRFTIYLGSTDGTVVWEEVQTAHTNDFGVFNLVIGKQDARTGGTYSSFTGIDWSLGTYYLQTAIKFDATFIDMGTTQVAWVPYAYYALKSGTSSSGSVIAVYDATSKVLKINDTSIDLSSLYADVSNTINNLSLNGNLLEYKKNGSTYSIDLSSFLDNTDKQSLSIDGQKLSISNGNFITLPTRDYQNLSVDGNTLSISNGTSVSFDPSSYNELQQLKIDGDSLIIYRPGQAQSDGKVQLPDLYEEHDSIFMKGYPKPNKVSLRHTLTIPKTNQLSISRGNTVYVDTDTTNEIQDLSLTNDLLKITKKVNSTGIDLSPYRVDNQTISRIGDTQIAISGNTSQVDISDMVNVPWVGFSATSSVSLQLNANNETAITWNEEFDDGLCLDNNIFTAKVAGIYNFSFNLNLSSANYSVKVYKNSTAIRSCDVTSSQFSHTMLLKLSAGDTIQIKVLNSAAYAMVLVSGYFSGYRVH